MCVRTLYAIIPCVYKRDDEELDVAVNCYHSVYVQTLHSLTCVCWCEAMAAIKCVQTPISIATFVSFCCMKFMGTDRDRDELKCHEVHIFCM